MAIHTLPICDFFWLGSIEYDAAWQVQARLAAQIASDARPPALLLLEHPHVYTLGRRADPVNLRWDDGERAQRGVQLRAVDRGGDVTYHGPGQLVGYPLLPLAARGWGGERLPQADFTGYLRKLEQALIVTLAHYGIVGAQRAGFTGVWLTTEVWARCPRCNPAQRPQPAKIASIGVKVDAKGVSRHGFALNVSPQREYWDGIVACGLEGVIMADMADFLEPPPPVEAVAQVFAPIFGEIFGYSMREGKELDAAA